MNLKNVQFIRYLFLIFGLLKNLLVAKEDYTANDPSNERFDFSKSHLFESMFDAFVLVRFPYLSQQTNGSVPFRINCHTFFYD